MKKLCHGKGKRVHPSPPPSSPRDFIAALPAAVLALAAALSPEEKEVLVYLLSGGANGFAVGRVSGKRKPHHLRKSHPPELGCGCFCCYKSFWARWDASPNHHLIHHILDAVEESLDIPPSVPSASRRRGRARRKDSTGSILQSAASEASRLVEDDGDDERYDDDDAGEEEDEEFDKTGEAGGDSGESRSPVRRLVSFIGERVWGGLELLKI